MASIITAAFIALLPVPVVYLFYRSYFATSRDVALYAECFAYGMLLAPLVLVGGSHLAALVPAEGIIAYGVLHIALIEKLGVFTIMLLVTERLRPQVTVSTLVVLAMFLGLGFATVENIIFAATASTSVLLVRFMSAVPLHVLTCGLIGYYLALGALSSSLSHRAVYRAAAFCIPVLFHGLYDTLLMLGGRMTFYTAGLLVLLVALMEYYLAKSQVYPAPRDLTARALSLEDWETIERQPQYARWILRSMGARNAETVPLIRISLSRMKMVVILAIALFATHFLATGGALSRWLGTSLTGQESLLVFVLIPVLYALQLALVGIVNPEYFKSSIIRIPIIIDALVTVSDGATDRDNAIDTVSFHVTGLNAFIKTADRLAPGTRVRCVMRGPRFISPPLEGLAAWDHHEGPEPLNGTLIRFTARPWTFWFFLARYSLFRVLRGLAFNLRLPGFRTIRRLFVRPVSVMQEEAHLPAGHVLFRQGDPGERFYLIRSGAVDIYKTSSEGHSILITTLGRGDILGEMAIVGNQPRIATAVCRTDCLLAVADPANLDALIRGNPSFTRTLIETLAGRFRESDEALYGSIERMNRSMHSDERLLYALMNLVRHTAVHVDARGVAPAAIDPIRLSHAIGCSPAAAEDLSRLINEADSEDDVLRGIDGPTRERIVRAFGQGRGPSNSSER